MIEQLKASSEIKIHLKSGKGYFVVENELKSFTLDEIKKVDAVNYILTNGDQVSEFDIKHGGIFEYCIDNGYDYELNDHTSVFSTKYFNNEEFTRMCKNAQTSIIADVGNSNSYKVRDIYSIRRKLLEMYSDIFFDIEFGGCFCPSE